MYFFVSFYAYLDYSPSKTTSIEVSSRIMRRCLLDDVFRRTLESWIRIVQKRVLSLSKFVCLFETDKEGRIYNFASCTTDIAWKYFNGVNPKYSVMAS